jgi:hypothetical protein
MKNNQTPEMADILFDNKQTFLRDYNLCPVQIKAIEDIIYCRTMSMGFHVDKCDQCGNLEFSYNSCRNRNCPKCQLSKQEVWTDKLKANILPNKHFHLVFTVPDIINPLFYLNQRQCYALLFKSAMEALKKTTKHYIGIECGAVTVLHTWGQTLNYHPHIHAIVPAGGPDQDGMQWIHSNNKFLVPIKAISAVFRALLVKNLVELLISKKIVLPQNSFTDIEDLKLQLYKKKWVVFAEKPMKGPQQVINYLGKYVNRVAISNHRIKSFENNKVSFAYKNYKDKGITKMMSLDAIEFINRFLHHILPSGFYKIRYFGIYASVNVQKKYQCFDLFGKTPFYPVLSFFSLAEVARIVFSVDFSICPVCNNGRMIRQNYMKTEPSFKT